MTAPGRRIRSRRTCSTITSSLSSNIFALPVMPNARYARSDPSSEAFARWTKRKRLLRMISMTAM